MTPEQLLGQIDDPVVHDDVVERAVLEGEARHDAVRIDPERLVARRVDVVGELLRRRDQAGQDRLRGRDRLGRQQIPAPRTTRPLPTAPGRRR